MSVAAMAIRSNCRSADYQMALTKGALFILFFGEGLTLVVPYVAACCSVSLSTWYVTRYNLLVTLPAALLGTWHYVKYGGIAKSAPLVGCVLWMAATLTWTEPTELGRGMVIFVGVAITLPLAALIVRTGLHKECSLWFSASFVVSLLLAFFHGMESTDGRFGDVVEGGDVVMNSNGVGCDAAIVLLLIYRLYEVHGAVHRRRGLPGAVYTFYLPALALGAAVLGSMSVSRTAAVSLGASVLVSLVWNVAKGSAVAFRILAILIFLGCLSFALGALDPWLERFTDNDIGSLNGRTDIWECGRDLAADLKINSFLGLGMGSSDKFLGCATGWGVVHPTDGILRCHSHNQYLEWFLELGLVGVVLGMWLMQKIVRTAWRLDQHDRTIHRRALLVYLVLFGVAGVVIRMEVWPAIGRCCGHFLRHDRERRDVNDCRCKLGASLRTNPGWPSLDSSSIPLPILATLS